MKSVMVFGTRVKISRVKNLIKDYNVRGLYYYEEKRIEIDASLKGDDYKATLLHELVHAVWDLTGLNQTAASTDVQELVAENISQFFTKTFKWNLRSD